MAVINLTAFSGEQPRLLPRLLPDTAAQLAVDVRLDDGGLTPTRKPRLATTLDQVGYKTIYKHNGDWLAWLTSVHAAPGPVASDRLYFTGDGVPKVRVDGDVYPLAVPVPANALTAALGGTGTGDMSTRVYVYTWVTAYGEESEPAPASEPIDWQPGQTVTLSGFTSTPIGRAINRQRIYRSQTGRSGTYLYLIAERAATNANFVDAVAVDDIKEPLPSANWHAPSDQLRGLVAMPNGMMAAFVDRELHFCEPYHPHAWPEGYRLIVDFPIVGLGSMGNSLVILTTGLPYLVTGTHPASMQMVELEENLPCINAGAIVDLGYAIAYPSNEGLVAVRADGSIGIVSSNLFSLERWASFSPKTMVAGQFAGRYVAFYDTVDIDGTNISGAFFVDIAGTPFLLRSGVRASTTFFDVEDSALYFAPPDEPGVYRYDPPDGMRTPMAWQSKEFVLPAADTFGAILIDSTYNPSGNELAAIEQEMAEAIAENEAAIAAGPVRGALGGSAIGAYPVNGDLLRPMPSAAEVTPGSGSIGLLTVTVTADGRKIATISKSGRPVRLPAGFRARRWEISVYGDVQIERIAMARTIDELKVTP